MSSQFLVAGLGNPGERYVDSRHNAGRIALEHMRKHLDFPDWNSSKSTQAQYSKKVLDIYEVELLAPQCFMNESGGPIQVAQQKHGIPSEYIVVLYDDIDLALGTFKISYDRGAGGHNGVTSVENKLGTKQFVRVRIGIAPVTFFGKQRHVSGEQRKRYVLQNFTRGERKRLDASLDTITEAVQSVIVDGREVAMNKYN